MVADLGRSRLDTFFLNAFSALTKYGKRRPLKSLSIALAFCGMLECLFTSIPFNDGSFKSSWAGFFSITVKSIILSINCFCWLMLNFIFDIKLKT